MGYCIAIVMCLFAFVASAQQKDSSIPFEKLTGSWLMERKNGTSMGETWEQKDANTMKGKSFLIQNGDTALLETVDLVKEGNEIFYIPVAYGQNDDKPVRFKLTSVKTGEYIFENPAHDFPKRIVYDFSSGNTLHAYIDDGTEKTPALSLQKTITIYAIQSINSG